MATDIDGILTISQALALCEFVRNEPRVRGVDKMRQLEDVLLDMAMSVEG